LTDKRSNPKCNLALDREWTIQPELQHSFLECIIDASSSSNNGAVLELFAWKMQIKMSGKSHDGVKGNKFLMLWEVNVNWTHIEWFWAFSTPVRFPLWLSRIWQSSESRLRLVCQRVWNIISIQ